MTLSADEAIDPRKLRRKLSFWRVVAFALAFVALIAGALWVSGGPDSGAGVDHIARVKIEGTITTDEELLDRLKSIRESDHVKGVVLAINSPGGTTAGGEAIYEEVRLLAAKKPVVAQVSTLAASAGYMIAAATDHIVARKSSIVGSIGVLVQYPDVTGLMDKVGVKMESIKSSPLKAAPSPFSPTTDEERAAVRSMIMDSYDWFVSIVQERRKFTREKALSLADGKVYTGRQALELELVDALGGEPESLSWLESKGAPKTLKVVDWKKKENKGLAALVTGAWAPLSDNSEIQRTFGKILGGDRLFLDGLVSLWQPE